MALAMNPISIAIKGKGPFSFVRRVASIVKRYGLTPGKMDRALTQFAATLDQFGCSATFPITCVALQRHPRVINKYQAQGIEFAVHGYRHLDHTQLSHAEQLTHLTLSRQVFTQFGIEAHGFRSPYLRWNPDAVLALQQIGFAYDSSQALAWDVLDGQETPAYRQVLDFYRALPANDYPSLPTLEHNLVRIPYSLPDDEALVERLSLKSTSQMSALWLTILHHTFQLGEVFTLGLHPERIASCREPLAAVLTEACRLSPPVWIASLKEIAAWWRARAEATVKISDGSDGKLYLTVLGPSQITVLARAVEVDGSVEPWADGYQQVEVLTFALRSPVRPFIGLSPDASPELADFLREQGYIVETSQEGQDYSWYFDWAGDFRLEHQRPLLAQIEGTIRPLVRLGRWPNGARSALSITGDIDAMTLWDYALRLVGR